MIETCLWRAHIGQFTHSHHIVSVRQILHHWDRACANAHLSPVCALVIAAVLLMAGDIEMNPGPKRKRESSELRAVFHSHSVQLYDTVSAQHAIIPRLADVLHESALIANDTRLAVKYASGLPPYERASLMLDPAIKLAQNSIQQAQKFCECLQKCEIQVPEEILSEVMVAYIKPGRKAERNEPHDKDINLQSIAISSQLTFQPTSNPLPEKVQVYKTHLKALYEKDRFPVYYKYPEHLKVDCYIKLAMVHKSLRKRDGQEDLTLRLHGKIDELYEKRSRVHICMDKVGYNVDGTLASRILVEGTPGIGKTTFAWELCRQWQSGHTLQEYDMMVMLQCRHEEVQQAKLMEDLVLHNDKDVCKAVFEYIRDKDGKGLFLLFEGFDELPTDTSKDSLIYQLLIGNVYTSATVMVTSRPITHRNLPRAFLFSLHQHIEILGFTEGDIEDYIRSAYSNEFMVADFRNYLSLHPFVFSTMFIPLQCAVITDLYAERWESGEKGFAPETFTALYTELVQTLLIRHMSDQSKDKEIYPQINDLKTLPTELSKSLLQLAKLAADGIEKQQYIFSGEGFDHLGLMQRVETIHTGRPSTIAYCFHHLTLQEYLAAYHWSNLSSEKVTTLITTSNCFPLQKLVTEGMKEKHESTVHHWPVLMFLAGLTRLEGVPTQVITELFQFYEITYYKWNYFSAALCHLLFEVQSPHLLSDVFKEKRFSPTCTTSLDWYIIGYCIAHSTTATWQIHYDYKLEHKPEHIQMLTKGVSSFNCSSDQSGCIDYLKLIGGPDLPKCLKLLPALVPYTSNLTVLDLRGNLPSEECVGICKMLQKHWSKLTAFKLVTNNTTAACIDILSTLHHLTDLSDLVLGFSKSADAHFPPQYMKKLTSVEINVTYTLALHEALIIPNQGLLQRISLKNCNMTQDYTQAVATFLQSPDCNINTVGMHCSSFRSNFNILVAALASTKSLKKLVIVECGIGMEGAEFITKILQNNDVIFKLYIVDDSITIPGAQLLMDVLRSRKQLILWLPDSFKKNLISTSQYHFTVEFKNQADMVERYAHQDIQEILRI